MISHNNFRLLQMGDLAGSAEHVFLKNNNNFEADVIKVAHHGAANDATSDSLLVNVKPRLAIISTSKDNWIDARPQQVLDRLEKHHTEYFRTDQVKTIELVVFSQARTHINRSWAVISPVFTILAFHPAPLTLKRILLPVNPDYSSAQLDYG